MGFSSTDTNGLLTESIASDRVFLDALPDEALYNALVDGQGRAIAAVQSARGDILRAVANIFPVIARSSSRLVYCGAGTSGRVALLDSVELNPTFNWPNARVKVLLAGGSESLFEAQEGAEDNTAQARKAILALDPNKNDVVIGLAASGTTPFVLSIIEAANAAGACTVGIANNPSTPLLAIAQNPILIETGPEALAGSTRLAAGTAQKITLNVLSTILMVKLGKVFKGRMVDMRVTNKKLKRRAIAMVADLTDCTPDLAEQHLEKTEYNIKEAILLVHGMSLDAAKKQLEQSGGNLGKALSAKFLLG